VPEADLGVTPLRELNASLHRLSPDTNERHWIIDHPAGRHAIAAGLNVPITVEINGPVGYYCAGMNKLASVRIDGNASSRCGISMKGIDIVVQGSVGHMSAFMAQAGNLIVFGDAGDSLGDSIYEARLFVRGQVKSLGADCIEKPMRDEHKRALREVLGRAGFNGAIDSSEFKRYGSARKLYNFHIDNAGAY
jgi:methylamine---glutamate N-methyltransferase subunit B